MTLATVLILLGVAAAIASAWWVMRRQRRELVSLHQSSEGAHGDAVGNDPLTGLVDRRGLIAAINAPRARRTDLDGDIAMIAFSLVGIGQLTETMGPDVGAYLIAEVGRRLDATIRSSEIVARTGEDRLTVALDPPITQFDATLVASRIAAVISEVVVIDQIPLQVDCRAGIAIGRRQDADQLISNAEFAANRPGHDPSPLPVVYDPAMRRHADLSFHRAQQLKTAVSNDELSVVYQPIHRLADGSLAGVEALVRWHNPILGAVSPTDFIPIAEDTGTILEVGEWVLEQACSDLTRIAPDGGLSMSVNASVHQLRSDGFVDMVRTVLTNRGIAPRWLLLEVTESTLACPDEIGTQLEQLRQLGVRIALDDVGTGYSALGQLAALPVDAIKLDRSLLHDSGALGGNALRVLTSLASLGESLGLDVVAEGVETDAQSTMAREAGCSHEQGFLRSKPVSLRQITAYARRSTLSTG